MLPTIPTSTSLSLLMRQFLEYCEIEKNRSNNTIQNYAFYLDRFITWAKKQHVSSAPDIDLELVRQYRLWLNRLGGMNPLKKNTQNYHLIALRSFLKYLSKRDIKSLAPEKIELAKMPERDVSFLEGDDLIRLLEAPLKAEGSLIIQKRDRAILEMLFCTGLRVSELSSLKRDSLNLSKSEFTVKGKGDKFRIVFVTPSALAQLKAYLDMRTDPHPPLFIRHDKAQSLSEKEEVAEESLFLTPRSIQRLVQKYAKVAGVTKIVTPHTMRHTFATDLLMNGADIRSVQALLGHASITTTQIYTHITNQQLRDVHRAFHGRRRKKVE